MKITRDDLKTVFIFGLHLARIDNRFDPFEQKLLAKVAQAIKLTTQEKEQLVKGRVSLQKSLRLLSGESALNLLAKTLCAVAHQDGVVEPEEKEFIHRVLSHSDKPVMLLPQEEWGGYEAEVLDSLAQYQSESL